MNEPSHRAERAVIGAVLLDGKSYDVAALEAEHFGDPRCRSVWEAIGWLAAKAAPIDTVTLEDQLRSDRRLEAVGGVSFLADLAMEAGSSANVEHYAEIVRRAALTRGLAMALSETLTRIKSGHIDGDDALGEILASVSRLSSSQPDEAVPIWKVVEEQCKEIERITDARLRGEEILVGIPTRIEKLDRLIGGLQTGIAHILAARPRVGKSSLGLAIADGVSAGGHGIHVFSLEDPRKRYGRRTLSRMAKVPGEKLKQGLFDRGEMQRLSSTMMHLRQRSHWILDDRSGITADEVVRSVRRRKRDNRTKVVIVDYLQLLRKPAGFTGSRHESLSESMAALCSSAKNDDIAYVIMSQLNRDLEKREDKRPQMSDLRESGSIEEMARCVIGMYRGSLYGKPVEGVDYQEGRTAPPEEEWKRMAELLVLKNTDGEEGVVHCQWDGATTRIE